MLSSKIKIILTNNRWGDFITKSPAKMYLLDLIAVLPFSKLNKKISLDTLIRKIILLIMKINYFSG